MHTRHIRLLMAGLVAGAAGAGVAVGAAGFAGAAAPSTPATCAGAARLTVHGSGTAAGTPDLLTVQVGVAVTGSTASAALDQDNGDTSAVVHAFESGGVTAADLQTTGLSIQPQYASAPSGGGPHITGYQATDTVTAKIPDLAHAGAVVDAVVGVGQKDRQRGGDGCRRAGARQVLPALLWWAPSRTGRRARPALRLRRGRCSAGRRAGRPLAANGSACGWHARGVCAACPAARLVPRCPGSRRRSPRVFQR